MDLKPRTLGYQMISKTVGSYEEIVWGGSAEEEMTRREVGVEG